MCGSPMWSLQSRWPSAPMEQPRLHGWPLTGGGGQGVAPASSCSQVFSVFSPNSKAIPSPEPAWLLCRDALNAFRVAIWPPTGPRGWCSHLARNLLDRRVVSVAPGVAQLAGVPVTARGSALLPWALLLPPALKAHLNPTKTLPAYIRLVLLAALLGDGHCHCGSLLHSIWPVTHKLAGV